MAYGLLGVGTGIYVRVMKRGYGDVSAGSDIVFEPVPSGGHGIV
jgi:hypothetical protein